MTPGNHICRKTDLQVCDRLESIAYRIIHLVERERRIILVIKKEYFVVFGQIKNETQRLQSSKNVYIKLDFAKTTNIFLSFARKKNHHTSSVISRSRLSTDTRNQLSRRHRHHFYPNLSPLSFPSNDVSLILSSSSSRWWSSRVRVRFKPPPSSHTHTLIDRESLSFWKKFLFLIGAMISRAIDSLHFFLSSYDCRKIKSKRKNSAPIIIISNVTQFSAPQRFLFVPKKYRLVFGLVMIETFLRSHLSL